MNISTTTEDRALDLLGQGLGPEVVASAIGVSTSRISQLLSSPEFSAQVAERRYRALSKHNERDNTYDALEDTLIDKLKDLLPFMVRPMEVLKAIQVINQAKRRGSSAPEHITNQQTVVTLIMPTAITTRYAVTVNAANQVIEAGQQALITVQSGKLPALLASAKAAISLPPPTESNSHEPSSYSLPDQANAAA